MRSLEDLIKELDAAEKEYRDKCRKYGIEESAPGRKRKTDGEEGTGKH